MAPVLAKYLPLTRGHRLSTGLRALDHAVENLYRPIAPYPIKILCYGAIADLFKYLPLSQSDPSSVEIRQKLQLAAWMSLWPQKTEVWAPFGLSHALGHKLGAAYGIPHGITSCLTLAPVVAPKAPPAIFGISPGGTLYSDKVDLRPKFSTRLGSQLAKVMNKRNRRTCQSPPKL